jgi:hypothetical protein
MDTLISNTIFMKKYILILLLTFFISPSLVNATVLYSQTITLSPDWNIISTPKVLESHSFSVPETSSNFDIYALDASKSSGWSTLADLNQTEFTPLFGYFINNKTGSNQTVIFNYKDVSIPEQLFSRTFTTPGWYSFGIANSSYAKSADGDNTDINNPDNILQSLIGTSVHYGDVVDFTDANSNTTKVTVSNPLKNATRSADISDSTEINTLKDFRETKGYAIYIKDSNVSYNGLQNKTVPQCQDGIDNDEDGNIDMLDTGCVNNIDNVEYTLPSKMVITSSSSNPDSSTIAVNETDVTNNVLIGTFNLDVDDDSSDIKINKIPVTIKITGAGTPETSPWSVIDDININIEGQLYHATLTNTSIDETGIETSIYLIDISDNNVVLDQGATSDIKIYADIKEFTDNYENGTTISADVNSSNIEADGVGTINEVELSGSFSGNEHILDTSGISVSNMKWSVNSTGTIVDFFFTIEAEDDDYTVLASEILDSTAGTSAFVDNTAASGAPVTRSEGKLTRYSGDDVDSVSDTGLKVAEGEKTTFRVRYSISDVTNNKWTEVKITSVAGQTVSDDLQTSPTATTSGF